MSTVRPVVLVTLVVLAVLAMPLVPVKFVTLDVLVKSVTLVVLMVPRSHIVGTSSPLSLAMLYVLVLGLLIG